MLNLSPMIWQLQGGNSFDKMRDVDYTSTTSISVSPDANGNPIAGAHWFTVDAQDCSPGVADVNACAHGGPYTSLNERRFIATNYTPGQEYRYYRLAIEKTLSQLSSPPLNYGTQVVELELFPPALLNVRLPIPIGTGAGKDTLFNVIEATLSASLAGPVHVLTKDLVTGDSTAINMKMFLGGTNPQAQVQCPTCIAQSAFQ